MANNKDNVYSSEDERMTRILKLDRRSQMRQLCRTERSVGRVVGGGSVDSHPSLLVESSSASTLPPLRLPGPFDAVGSATRKCASRWNGNSSTSPRLNDTVSDDSRSCNSANSIGAHISRSSSGGKGALLTSIRGGSSTSTRWISMMRRSKRKWVMFPLLLLLILYGFVSMVCDAVNEIWSVVAAKRGREEFAQRTREEARFPGGFRTIDGSVGGGSVHVVGKPAVNNSDLTMDSSGHYYSGSHGPTSGVRNGYANFGDSANKNSLMGRMRGIIDGRARRSVQPQKRGISIVDETQRRQQQPQLNDMKQPAHFVTMNDVPDLTDLVLKQEFAHALDISAPRLLSTATAAAVADEKGDVAAEASTTAEVEVLFYWSVGGTDRGPSGVLPQNIYLCFKNVVTASRMATEEELNTRPDTLRVIANRDGSGNSEEPMPKGKYVNVNLFSPEGVRRAADLGLLYQTRIPVMEIGSTADPATTTEFAKHIDLMVSPFLPEVASGLFSPPASGMGVDASTEDLNSDPALALAPSTTTVTPVARIHAVLSPPSVRINAYYNWRTRQLHSPPLGSNGSLLQFVSGPSIMVNNYVTRILSGLWDVNAAVTKVHLEVAKNVANTKVRFWPTYAIKNMVRHWSDFYGWDNPEGDGSAIDCMYPPVAEPPEAPKRKPRSDLDKEIDRIIKERNELDLMLFSYVKAQHRERMESLQKRQ